RRVRSFFLSFRGRHQAAPTLSFMSSSDPHSSAPPPASDPTVRPTLSWVFRSPARMVAFGFGSGLIRPAPGTWGTLFGWLLWIVVVSRLTDTGIALALVVSFAYGCWVRHRTGRELGRSDHGGMVWDEIVAFWLVLWLV